MTVSELKIVLDIAENLGIEEITKCTSIDGLKDYTDIRATIKEVGGELMVVFS